MKQLSTRELIKLSPMEQTKHAAKLSGYQSAQRGEPEPFDSLPGSAWSKWSRDGYAQYQEDNNIKLVQKDDDLVVRWEYITKSEYLSITGDDYHKSEYYTQIVTNKAGTRYMRTLVANYNM